MPRQSSKPKAGGLKINSKVAPFSTKGDASPDPKSSPMALEGVDLSSFGGEFTMEPLPPLPLSPRAPPPDEQHKRENSKTSLAAGRSRITSEPESKEQRAQTRQAKDDEDFRPTSSSMSKIYHLRKNPGSTPELSLVGSKENVRKQSAEGTVAPNDVRPQPSPHDSADSVSVKRKDKGFRNPLSRSKSIRRDSESKPKSKTVPLFDQPPKTAPISNEWQDMLLKARQQDKRGKSAERAVASESDENTMPERPRQQQKEKENKNGFVSGSKNVMSKAVTGGGNFLKGLGKMGRSASSHEKEVPDSEYRLKIIKLPLIEQTRITRISKDLAQCRDKTEFWMPSLPWRCIDYLNQNCESEGLYRIPGSSPQIKHWQRRFDTELDVDLLDEQELYDPNTIGSMLKTWLRDLPTEIMPKELQSKLAAEIAVENPEYQKIGQPAPQALRDALSNLPPFNYYLLFAITCHLSLLLSHQDKNKMDLNNLSICIGPCLDLERWLFNYLVGDWRHCWQGCFTEKQYLEIEELHRQGIIQPGPTNGVFEQPDDNDRPVYSSGRGSSRSRAASTQGSRYEDARSTQHSPQRSADVPDVPQASALLSKHANTGSMTPERKPVADLEPRRPSTAGKQSDKDGTPTPKQSHTRSKSDYQVSPIKPSSPVDFPFIFRES